MRFLLNVHLCVCWIVISFALFAVWGVLNCTGKKCGIPSCNGMTKSDEFDIQFETEECVKIRLWSC